MTLIVTNVLSLSLETQKILSKEQPETGDLSSRFFKDFKIVSSLKAM